MVRCLPLRKAIPRAAKPAATEKASQPVLTYAVQPPENKESVIQAGSSQGNIKGGAIQSEISSFESQGGPTNASVCAGLAWREIQNGEERENTKKSCQASKDH